MKYPGFCGPSYRSQSLSADAQMLMNWYVEKIESGDGNSPLALYPSPGTKTFDDLSRLVPPTDVPEVVVSISQVIDLNDPQFHYPVGYTPYIQNARTPGLAVAVRGGIFNTTPSPLGTYNPAWGTNLPGSGPSIYQIPLHTLGLIPSVPSGLIQFSQPINEVDNPTGSTVTAISFGHVNGPLVVIFPILVGRIHGVGLFQVTGITDSLGSVWRQVQAPTLYSTGTGDPDHDVNYHLWSVSLPGGIPNGYSAVIQLSGSNSGVDPTITQSNFIAVQNCSSVDKSAFFNWTTALPVGGDVSGASITF